ILLPSPMAARGSTWLEGWMNVFDSMAGSVSGSLQHADDGIDGGVGQIRVHGESEDAAAQILAYRHRPALVAESGEGALSMQSDGIVDSGGDTADPELLAEDGAPLRARAENRVVRPGAAIALRHHRRPDL